MGHLLGVKNLKYDGLERKKKKYFFQLKLDKDPKHILVNNELGKDDTSVNDFFLDQIYVCVRKFFQMYVLNLFNQYSVTRLVKIGVNYTPLPSKMHELHSPPLLS